MVTGMCSLRPRRCRRRGEAPADHDGPRRRGLGDHGGVDAECGTGHARVTGSSVASAARRSPTIRTDCGPGGQSTDGSGPRSSSVEARLLGAFGLFDEVARPELLAREKASDLHDPSLPSGRAVNAPGGQPAAISARREGTPSLRKTLRACVRTSRRRSGARGRSGRSCDPGAAAAAPRPRAGSGRLPVAWPRRRRWAPRGMTCSPREARWIALRTSRAWVSFPRHALAPKASSWADSSADRPSPSRTRRVSGMLDAELAHLARSTQRADVEDQHAGRCACSITAMRS